MRHNDENEFYRYFRELFIDIDCSYFSNRPLLFLDSFKFFNDECCRLIDDVQGFYFMNNMLDFAGCLDSGLL